MPCKGLHRHFFGGRGGHHLAYHSKHVSVSQSLRLFGQVEKAVSDDKET